MIRFYPLYLLTPIISLFSGEMGHFEEKGLHYYPLFEKGANEGSSALFEKAALDRIGFWETCAEKIDWFRKWDAPFEWDCPYAKWYIGGKLNISYNCLDRHLANNADKPALIWANEVGEERIVTYQEIYEETCRLANGLKNLNVRKGDIVTIYMPMVPEAIAAMLACTRIGAIHSVVFAGTGLGSFKEKIVDANAKVLLTADVTYRRGKTIDLAKPLEQMIEECPSIEHVIVLERRMKGALPQNPKYISYQELTEATDVDCPPAILDSEDPSFVLYTSGTTGKPKGILHTTGGYLVAVHNTFNWVFDHKPTDVFWCTADIGWITGHSYVVYGPMSNGATQIIYEGTFDYPNKDCAWNLIEKYKANVFYTAPTLIRTFMKWGDSWIQDHDLSSLRLLGSIGEPLNPEAWSWYHDTVGKQQCPIVDTWFQTETGAFVISPIAGHTPLKPGSIAKALPGYEVGILNEKGEEVEHGLLAIKSPFPSMMRGLLNDPVRYYNTYWAKWDGKYYYAGDDATIDEDHYLWCRGRADEVIKVSGHRIGTAETENVIVGYPGVSESAVIGVQHPIKGQQILAFVVLREGVEITADLEGAIQHHVADYMGKYAQPERIIFVRDLPKTRSGKILRRILSNLIEGKEVGDTTTLVNPDIIEELVFKCNELCKDGLLK
ncbi:MAG: acetate--CoA ligase [Chlamydiia bacterium]